MEKPILNIDEIQYMDWSRGDKYAAKLGMFAHGIGARRLGYNVTVLPPGKAAFPRHSHWVNEEMFFVLDGSGEVRIGEDSHPIRQGDFIACPPGGPETAHQILNTSETEDLRFLAVSTVDSPEICEYPDSAKTGITFDLPGAKPGPDESSRKRFICHKQATMDDYWEGE